MLSNLSNMIDCGNVFLFYLDCYIIGSGCTDGLVFLVSYGRKSFKRVQQNHRYVALNNELKQMTYVLKNTRGQGELDSKYKYIIISINIRKTKTSMINKSRSIECA